MARMLPRFISTLVKVAVASLIVGTILDHFGLSAGVVSDDLSAITRCIHELRCGTVNVRAEPGFRTEATPFGGIKASGLGAKEGVVESMRAMTNVKLATIPWP